MKISKHRRRMMMVKKFLSLSIISVCVLAFVGVFAATNFSIDRVFKQVVSSSSEKNTEIFVDVENIAKNSNDSFTYVSKGMGKERNGKIANTEHNDIADKGLGSYLKINGDRDSLKIDANKAKLDIVIQALEEKFGIDIVDYTGTLNGLVTEQSYVFTGNLLDVLNQVLDRYGYYNTAVSNGIQPDTTIVYLLDKYNIEFDETERVVSNQSILQENPTTINRLLSGLALNSVHASAATAEAGNPIQINNTAATTTSVNQNISRANTTGSSDVHLNTASNSSVRSTNIDLENGVIPQEIQNQLAIATKQAVADVQDLVDALKQNEALLQAKRNQNQ